MGTRRGYKGIGMEGAIANWYARNTGRDLSRFKETADLVAERVRPGGDLLEVAPGPGYFAIEMAKRGCRVTTLDVSRSFVRIARENAAAAGVAVDARCGNASDMPFPDATFDYIVCIAAFKNFSDPVGALDEMHRVLRPGGEAAILDLRKDATRQAINDEVRKMRLSVWEASVTRWIFRFFLARRAYTGQQLERLMEESRFRAGNVVANGIGFELRLRKPMRRDSA